MLFSARDVQTISPKKPAAAAYIKDRYYVYALFKRGDVDPFYVGKGINNRINQHFTECNLRESDSRKNKTIRKYMDSIRREILCYFDSEQSAFDFEEYLIGVYKLADEGGCLFNVAKSRHEFPESSKKIISEKKTARTVVYSEEEVVTLYRNYFEFGMTRHESVTGTTIPKRYAQQIVKGEKFKGLYAKYIESGLIKNLRTASNDIIRKDSKSHKVSDQTLIETFELVCSGQIMLQEVCKDLGVSPGWLGKVFCGVDRPYLNLDIERYAALPKGRSVGQERSYSKFKDLYPAIEDARQLAELIGKSKPRIHAYIRRYKQEMEA